MFGEAPELRVVDLVVARPRPATKLRRLIILKRLVDFFFAVHDKRAVLHNGFVDRAPLQHQYFRSFCTVLQKTFLSSVYIGSMVVGNLLTCNS